MRRAMGLLVMAVAAAGVQAAEIKVLENNRADWWEIRAEYPVFYGQGVVPHAINQKAKSIATQGFNEYLKSAREEMPELKRMGAAGFYTYDASCTPHLEYRDLMTCHWSIYGYAAGAHGSVWFKTLNYGFINGKAVELKLKDLFVSGVDANRQTSIAVIGHLMKDERYDEMWEENQITLSPELLSNFVITSKGLLFLFGHYSLAAYVFGTFEVLVPFEELMGLDPKGPLKSVLEARAKTPKG